MFRKHPILAVSLALAAVWGPSAHAGDLVVSAAASLTNAFKDVAQAYEKEHAGTKVILNFGASDVLLQQIVKGCLLYTSALVWGVAAMVVQLVVYAVVARAIRGLNEAIEENNIAMGGLIGSISLAAGVVNAACLT